MLPNSECQTSNSVTYPPNNSIKSIPQAPPLPPPPPPMPNQNFNNNNNIYPNFYDKTPSDTLDLDSTSKIKPHMRMRTLNWRRIPKRKILCPQQQQQQLKDSNIISRNRATPTTRKLSSPVSKLGEQEAPTAQLDNDDEQELTNLWFLIAKENKTLKKIDKSCQLTTPTTNSTCKDGTRSASRIREMLDSVRRRMAAVAALTPDLVVLEEQKRPKCVLDAIDFDDLENLFCLNNQPIDLIDSESPNFVRRSSMRTNASSDSVISSSYSCSNDSNNDDDDDIPLFENILDSKKSLNVNIFLKQLKSPEELIEQVNRDERSQIGKERLENLLKLLPDETEKAQLMRFLLKNRQTRLPIAERFLLQLISEVPNLKLKIKFMLLQEEYYNELEANVKPELEKIECAASEIRASKMLRDTLNLVLVTGNFLNAGGYAADAAGFSLDCLERLSEVRSNKPNVSLIHYVAEVANKLDLIEFQQRDLPHVEPASRVCIDSIKLDLKLMTDKLVELKRDTDKEVESNPSCKESQLFLLNLLRTLDDIKNNVEYIKRLAIFNLEETRKQLANYMCEDLETFNLHDCFRHILTFSQRLKSASEDNERRYKMEMARYDRSNCTLRRSNTINPRLLKCSGSRQSLGNMNVKQNHQQSIFPHQDSDFRTEYQSKRASLASDSVISHQSQFSNLSRTTSTFNVSSKQADNDQELDDLHEGLMRLLDDTKNRRSSGSSSGSSQRGKLYPFGTYRRTSKLFPKPQLS